MEMQILLNKVVSFVLLVTCLFAGSVPVPVTAMDVLSGEDMKHIRGGVNVTSFTEPAINAVPSNPDYEGWAMFFADNPKFDFRIESHYDSNEVFIEIKDNITNSKMHGQWVNTTAFNSQGTRVGHFRSRLTNYKLGYNWDGSSDPFSSLQQGSVIKFCSPDLSSCDNQAGGNSSRLTWLGNARVVGTWFHELREPDNDRSDYLPHEARKLVDNTEHYDYSYKTTPSADAIALQCRDVHQGKKLIQFRYHDSDVLSVAEGWLDPDFSSLSRDSIRSYYQGLADSVDSNRQRFHVFWVQSITQESGGKFGGLAWYGANWTIMVDYGSPLWASETFLHEFGHTEYLPHTTADCTSVLPSERNLMCSDGGRELIEGQCEYLFSINNGVPDMHRNDNAIVLDM